MRGKLKIRGRNDRGGHREDAVRRQKALAPIQTWKRYDVHLFGDRCWQILRFAVSNEDNRVSSAAKRRGDSGGCVWVACASRKEDDGMLGQWRHTDQLQRSGGAGEASGSDLVQFGSQAGDTKGAARPDIGGRSLPGAGENV
jgi:hypothetical protein